MSTDLLDDPFRLYRYVRQIDRRFARLRRAAASRQPVVGVKSLLLIFLVIIPALAGASFLIQRIHTQYVLLTEPPGSTTAHTGFVLVKGIVMMKLYSSGISPFSHRCCIMLYEKSIDFQIIDVDPLPGWKSWLFRNHSKPCQS